MDDKWRIEQHVSQAEEEVFPLLGLLIGDLIHVNVDNKLALCLLNFCFTILMTGWKGYDTGVPVHLGRCST